MEVTTFPLVGDCRPTTGPAVVVGPVVDRTEGGAALVAELLHADLDLVRGPTPAADAAPVELHTDRQLDEEAYRLTVGDQITLEASTHSGWLYGGQTLLQLLRGDDHRVAVPRSIIEDAPVMAVRGQMIDVGRKYLPLDVLRREIRRMAWYKLNSLHLHLTEWNGFRFGSRRHPGLASPEHYSLEELQQLDGYARQWGVTIVPEIDLPGHAVWMTAYDARLRFVDSPLDIGDWPGGAAGGWTIDYTSDHARTFVKELLTEVAETFAGDVVHIGGDEVPAGEAVNRCPRLAAHAATHGMADPADVLVDFTNDLAAHLRALGKGAELWEWWAEFGQTPTTAPDKDIRIAKWLPDRPPTVWSEQGWDVVGVNWNHNFCTPGYGTAPGERTPEGFDGFMPAERNYEENTYPHGRADSGARVLGYRLGRWMDRAEWRPYPWLDFHARRGLQVIAERTWARRGSPDAVTAFERADQVGSPPGWGESTTLPRAAIARVETSSAETTRVAGHPDHLVDHDRRTCWTSRYTGELAMTPHRIDLTLQSRRRVAGVTLTPRQDGLTTADFHHTAGLPREVSVHLADGSEDFVEVWRGEVPRHRIATEVDLDPTWADRIRVVVHSDWASTFVVTLAGVDVRVVAA